MNDLPESTIKSLFSNLCCSRCKNEFSINSLKLIKSDCGIGLYSLTCAKCGKDFGEIVLNINSKSNKHTPLEILDGPPPITADDVINAHRFIKKL